MGCILPLRKSAAASRPSKHNCAMMPCPGEPIISLFSPELALETPQTADTYNIYKTHRKLRSRPLGTWQDKHDWAQEIPAENPRMSKYFTLAGRYTNNVHSQSYTFIHPDTQWSIVHNIQLGVHLSKQRLVQTPRPPMPNP